MVRIVPLTGDGEPLLPPDALWDGVNAHAKRGLGASVAPQTDGGDRMKSACARLVLELLRKV